MGALGSLALALVASSGAGGGDLASLSIDTLANLKVVAVSQRADARGEALGAHVIAVEDIPRSGMTPVPDALRLSPGMAASPRPQEYEVKAAFIYHFAHLVEWPAPAASREPFVIAVVGEDAFGAALDEVLAGRSVRGQAVRIQRFAGSAQIDGARIHMLFIGRGGDKHARRALSAVAGHPVLTIGDSPRFAERGGMIAFRVTAEGRVAFDINRQRAEQAGLRISSQLLKLARIVGPGR